MAILRVRDAEGNIFPIPAIKGDKGDKGGGILIGSYVGDGSYQRMLTLPLEADAVMILCAQTAIPTIQSEKMVYGVPLNGAFITPNTPLVVGGIELASLSKVSGATNLYVKNWSFTMQEDSTMRSINFNGYDVTYNYIVFTGEEGEM